MSFLFSILKRVQASYTTQSVKSTLDNAQHILRYCLPELASRCKQILSGLAIITLSIQLASAQSPAANDTQITDKNPTKTTQNLATEIETLKQAMINLNRDLFILEEDLLFPSSNQLAVFLALDVGEYFSIDSIEIRINGEVKTHYLYTEKQVDALYRGGVQRVYMGNVNQGKHTLSAYFIGIGPENREYKRAVSIDFEKDEDPVAIELNVVDASNKQQPTFSAKTL